MSKRFDTKEEPKSANNAASVRFPLSRKTPNGTIAHQVPSIVIQGDEAAALEAMFAAEQANWNDTQEKMSHAQRVHTASRFGNRRGNSSSLQGPHRASTEHQQQGGRFHPYSERPIPPGYVCYRCGQKGHWIQDCPTNKDKEWDGKPRLKRTTGIPRSFLKAVDNPESSAGGVMITPEGKLVVAQPDSASWEKQLTGKTKGLTEADVREKPLLDSSLACPICSNLFRDAVRTPCCSKSFCEECIQTHLLENDFTCPNCQKSITSLDRLSLDKPMRTRVMDYIDKQIAMGSIEGNLEAAEDSQQQHSRGDSPVDAEVSFDRQPGGPSDVVQQTNIADSEIQSGYRENQSFDQIQAEIQQLQTMLSNPKLPMHIRNSASMQLMQKQTLLTQAQTMSTFISQAQAAAAMEGAMMQAMYSQSQMNYGAQQGFNQQGGWINPETQINQSHTDSPYQRLPINQRRKYMKRDRPSDFVEVSEQYYQ